MNQKVPEGSHSTSTVEECKRVRQLEKGVRDSLSCLLRDNHCYRHTETINTDKARDKVIPLKEEREKQNKQKNCLHIFILYFHLDITEI